MQKNDNLDNNIDLTSVIKYAEDRARIKHELNIARKAATDEDDELNRSDENYKKALEAKELSHEEYILNPSEIRNIIEIKQNKQNPNRQLNCKVFDKTESVQLKEHLEDIINNAEKYEGQRFQIIIQSVKKMGLDYHWSVADILVSNGIPDIIHLDTITQNLKPYKGGANFKEIERALESIKIDREITIHDSYCCDPVSGSSIDMQADGESCGIYATSLAFAMSKIPDLHSIANLHARKKPNEYRSFDNNHIHENYLEIIHLPAVLLKNVQMLDVVERYNDLHKNDDVNKVGKKSKTLKKFVADRTVDVATDKGTKKINYSIFFSRAHYKEAIRKDVENKKNEPKK